MNGHKATQAALPTEDKVGLQDAEVLVKQERERGRAATVRR
jgi:hypothetical protein